MHRLLRNPYLWSTCLIGYVVTPHLLFFGGWLQTIWALCWSALLLSGAWFALREVKILLTETDIAHSPIFSVQALFIIGSAATAFVLLSGVGGFGFQNYDWNKHNAVLQDLVEKPWPVTYADYYGRPIALVYYFAYYLPAAFVGKGLGWQAANVTLAVWSILGLILASVLFLHASLIQRLWPTLFIFFFFSGLDVVGSLLTHSPFHFLWPAEGFPDRWSYWFNQDAWSAWQYSSHVKLLFAVPNQAIAGWLLTGLLALPILSQRPFYSALFFWGTSLFWSPFLALGLSPILMIAILSTSMQSLNLRRYVNWPNTVGIFLLCLTALFYASKLAPIAPPVETDFRSGFYFAQIEGWAHRFSYAFLLIVFYGVEFGVFGWCIWRSKILRQRPDRQLFLAATAWLLALPLWTFGEANDLVMRASIPALWVYALFLAQTVHQVQAAWLQRSLWVCIVIAALNPLQDISYHLQQVFQRSSIWSLPAQEETLLLHFYDSPSRLIQYIGSEDTLFFNVLGKPVEIKSAQASPLLFGDSLVLHEFQLSAHNLAPGEQARVTLRLENWRPTATDLSLATRLIDKDGKVLWEAQGWPAGRSTRTWQPFKQYIDERILEIPTYAASGSYVLELYVFDPAALEKLPVALLPDQRPVGEIALVDYVNIYDESVLSKIEPPIDFGNQFRLIGSAVQRAPDMEGRIKITLHWELLKDLEDVEKSYVLTVQALDQNKALQVQQDGPLLGGLLPLTSLRAGAEIIETVELTLPETAEDNIPHIFVAWYDPHTGERLPVLIDGDLQMESGYFLENQQ